jgi:hypothetical protein
MTDADLQPPKFQEGAREQASRQLEPASFDAYRSILRLLVGLALIGGDDLIARLRAWEAGHPPEPTGSREEPEVESAGDLARRALIGMVFEVAETARQVVFGVAGLSASFAGAVGSFLRPVADSFLFRPLSSSIRAMVPRREDRLARYTRTGRAEEQRSRKLAGEVTGLLMEDVVSYAGTNPGVLALVDAQVERLLPALVADPTIQALLVEQLGTWIAGLATRPESLDPLVREVGDRYIAYLNEHPDDVQNLVQGQAVGMASEVRDSVRTIGVTGDTALEMLVRSILRRTPREDLPPPDIRRRDESAPRAAEQAQPQERAR